MPRSNDTIETKKPSQHARFLSLLVGLMALAAAIAPIASAGWTHP
jgi:hypothetical protein